MAFMTSPAAVLPAILPANSARGGAAGGDRVGRRYGLNEPGYLLRRRWGGRLTLKAAVLRAAWLIVTLATALLAGVLVAAEPDSGEARGRVAAPQAEDMSASRDALTKGFLNPPKAARPSTYWLWLNGYVNRAHIERELRAFQQAGISGLCLFDMGARGAKDEQPPTGPAFLSEEWLRSLAHAVRIAGELGMGVQLSVASSWDMGGAWVEPEHASMGLYHVEWEVTGPAELDQLAPFPPVPAKAPRKPNGQPVYSKDIALLAIPLRKRRPGHEFLFQLEGREPHLLDRVVLYNACGEEGKDKGASGSFAKDFSVAVSVSDARGSSFREVLRGTLRPVPRAQPFDLRPRPKARFVRLRILNGHNPRVNRVALAEFEGVWQF
ncbi:MAG: hypothetical protein GXP27_11465 [Planctomycetes bacterium]|nr:hypothetical protein [Planctomycetota bacterium]